METLIAIGFLAFIGYILWKSRRAIWLVVLFLAAFVTLVAWEGLLLGTPELALIVGFFAALLGAWRFVKRRA